MAKCWVMMMTWNARSVARHETTVRTVYSPHAVSTSLTRRYADDDDGG